MRLLIFSYNPRFIPPNEIHKLSIELDKLFNCTSLFVQHFNDNEEPFYCVQFCDSGDK